MSIIFKKNSIILSDKDINSNFLIKNIINVLKSNLNHLFKDIDALDGKIIVNISDDSESFDYEFVNIPNKTILEIQTITRNLENYGPPF